MEHDITATAYQMQYRQKYWFVNEFYCGSIENIMFHNAVFKQNL